MDELSVKVLLAELTPVLRGASVAAVYRVSSRAVSLKFLDGALTLASGEGGALFYARERGKVGRERVRSALDGATFVSAKQWHDDRLVVFELATAGGALRLVAEFFGRAGGVFVLEDNVVGARLAGRRVNPEEEYSWPADRGRAPATPLSAGEVARYMAADGAAALARDVAYMSPWVARAVLAGGDAGAAARRLAVFARAAAGEDIRPVAVSLAGVWRPFPCDIFDAAGADEVRPFEAINDAVAFAYAETERARELAAARGDVERRLLAKLKRLERQREALERRREDYSRYGRYRRMGEALKYNLAAVRKGMASVKLPDPYGSGDVDVELERALSAAANVERLFALYRKSKRGVEAVGARLEALAEELGHVRGDLERAQRASDAFELEPWLEERKVSRKEREVAAAPGRRFLSADGLAVLVGRSAAENDELTFKYARPYDLWLHAEQARGSHVIVRRADKNKPVPRRTVEEAAALAAFYSSAKHAGLVPVVVAERRYVRRAKGPAGRVTYGRGDVVFVEPAQKLKPAPSRGPE
jgi:predicted ribosome quality control (RQC) complex YloA/Tae2 family protein